MSPFRYLSPVRILWTSFLSMVPAGIILEETFLGKGDINPDDFLGRRCLHLRSLGEGPAMCSTGVCVSERPRGEHVVDHVLSTHDLLLHGATKFSLEVGEDCFG